MSRQTSFLIALLILVIKTSQTNAFSPYQACITRIGRPSSCVPGKNSFLYMKAESNSYYKLLNEQEQNHCYHTSTRRRWLSKLKYIQIVPMITTNLILIDSATASDNDFNSGKNSLTQVNVGGSIVYGENDIMNPKEHGTTRNPVQNQLRFGVSRTLADRICCYNRYFAELGGYFKETDFETMLLNSNGPLTFYDSVTGKPLFVAPIGRSVQDFLAESKKHGWPSFRDQEVVWNEVRVLKSSGETVSLDGTHLGHNLPDKLGNRYCINLVSIAGNPA